MRNSGFTPRGTTSIAATTTSTNIALSAGRQQRVYNSSTLIAFVAYGTSSVSATTASIPVANGLTEIQNSEANTYAAAIMSTAGGAATVYFTAGEGG